MAAKKLNQLLKEARTEAGLTQEALAKKVKGLTATDISKAERGELVPTQEQLKQIAKVTGVTQKSLLEAPKGSNSSGKTSSGKTSASGKKSGNSGKSSSDKNTMTLTAAEKKLVQAYRKADEDTKKDVMELLDKKNNDKSELGSALQGFLGDVLQNIIKK